jgi:Methyltransferase domain
MARRAAAARELKPADLRVGPIERLPWRDESFDLVTGFNAFQFAGDFVAALTEAGRARRVAICSWGRIEDRQVHAILAPLREVEPPPQDTSPYDPPPIGEPGVLEDLARRAGLDPERADEVEVPYEFPDRPTLERSLLDRANSPHRPGSCRAGGSNDG